MNRAPKEPSGLTLEEIRRHQVWKKLSAPQKRFVTYFIESGGDKTKAGLAAWNTSKPKVAVSLSNRALRRPLVRTAIGLWQGVEANAIPFRMTRAELSDLIARRLRSAEKMPHSTFSKLVDQFIALRGWNPVAPGATKSPPVGQGESVDDLVLAAERARRSKRENNDDEDEDEYGSED